MSLRTVVLLSHPATSSGAHGCSQVSREVSAPEPGLLLPDCPDFAQSNLRGELIGAEARLICSGACIYIIMHGCKSKY